MGKVGLWFFSILLLFGQKAPKKKRTVPSLGRDTTAWRQAMPHFTRGVVLFSQGLTEEASGYFYEAAEAAPHSAGVHHYLARMAYQQGDPIRMLTHAEKAYREAPEELWLGLAYAGALQLNGQQAQAVALLEKLAASAPREPEVLLRLAQAYQSLGNWEKADLWYCKLQHLSGAYEETFQTRIQMFVEAGRLDKAIAIAESSAVLWPRHEIYWETAARLYELARNLPKMAETVQRLIEIDPANETAWSLVLSYWEVFEELWGVEAWERLLESYAIPVEVKYTLLRRIDFLEEGEYIEALRKLLAEAPAPVGWDLYAQYWAQRGQWDSAAVGWKRACVGDSVQLNYVWPYLYALWRLGGGDSLAKEVDRLQEVFPGQGRLFLWAGVAQAQRKSWAEALRLFQRGWRFLPSTDTPLAQVALYYQAIAEAGEGNLSSTTLQRLQAVYPPDIGTALSTVLRLRQKSPPAEDLNRVSALPSSASPFREWALLLAAMAAERPEEARRHAAIADTGLPLPLEMWEDIFVRLGPTWLGAAYTRWRLRAQKDYPLARIWNTLP